MPPGSHIQGRPGHFVGSVPSIRLCLLALALALALGAGTVWADPINCSTTSINAILENLDKSLDHHLTIIGMCTEAVVVDGFTSLWLEAASAGDGIQRPAGQESPALEIRNSNVSIMGLTVQGPGKFSYSPALVRVVRSSVVIEGSTIQNSRSNGLNAEDSSNVTIGGSTIQNNYYSQDSPDTRSTGISATGNSRISISAYWPPEPTLIQGNGTGVSAGGGAVIDVGNAVIQNTYGTAVSAGLGGLINLGTWGGGAPTITYNTGSPAVSAGNGGEVWLIDATKIQANQGDGVNAGAGGRVIVCCSPDTSISDNEGWGASAWAGGEVFFWGQAVVEDNRRGGLSLSSSQGFVNAGVVIRRNGDPGDPQSKGGVELGSNATLYGSWTVTDNYGPGVFAWSGADAQFYQDSTITGNRGYGVQLEMNATATFSDGVTVTGNKGLDLLCASGGVAGAARGMHPRISKMKCPTWAQLPPAPAWVTPTADSAASVLSRRPVY